MILSWGIPENIRYPLFKNISPERKVGRRKEMIAEAAPSPSKKW